MRVWSVVVLAGLSFGIANAVTSDTTHAEERIRRVALKSGETIDLMSVYWVANCKLIMLGIPEIEILEGPPEVSLTIKQEQVLPRRQGCVNKVPGGVLFATAKDVKTASESKLTFRLKYKTRDGDRPTAYVFQLSLFP